MNSAPNQAAGFADYVEVNRTDRLWRNVDLMRRLTVKNPKGETHLKLKGPSERCVALTGRVGREVGCKIYGLRPEPCRLVEPGDDECKERRQDRGIGRLVRLGRARPLRHSA